MSHTTDLLRTAHSQIRHLIDDLVVPVDDDGLTTYVPRPGLMFSNLITALIPLAVQMRQALDAGEPTPPLFACDLAEILDTHVPAVCAALVQLGHPPRSTNMPVTPTEAVAVARHLNPTRQR